MKFARKFFGYLNPAGFIRRSEDEKNNASLRFMHGTNRISIWMMTVAVIIMIIRYFLL
jgi:hypothetical protein